LARSKQTSLFVTTNSLTSNRRHFVGRGIILELITVLLLIIIAAIALLLFLSPAVKVP
jgi:hypothetical protein